MMMISGETLSGLGSSLAGYMFIWATFQQFTPKFLQDLIESLWYKTNNFFFPYIEVTFDEYASGYFKRNQAYVAIKTYLNSKSTEQASRLKAESLKKKRNLVYAMDDSEEVSDEFRGLTVTWYSGKSVPRTQQLSLNPSSPEEKRFYMLRFHRKHREIITGEYMRHVMEEAKRIEVKTRQRKLYTNNPIDDWWDYGKNWSQVAFEHPATFDTLALDPKKKEEIINDLMTFSKAKEYYAKLGKAWKRGYLLYGPPGTGKSTMIAAMANLLDYDVYDLELTAVRSNIELKKLLIDISSKSIVVIEDIDCSLNLTGKRKNKKGGDDDEETNPIKKALKKDSDDDSDSERNGKVTLSGLLNFIDGLWSACGGERIIVFTTNHVDKLDPALIRRGRMDKHIELSYCCFEAFKILAKNYLGIEYHNLYDKISKLLGETNMSPADVAENLTPTTAGEEAETCLKRLVEALQDAKGKADIKAAANKYRKPLWRYWGKKCKMTFTRSMKKEQL